MGRMVPERSTFERLIPDVLRRGLERGIEAGLSTLSFTDERLRNLRTASLAREIANYLFAQIDETKNGLMKAVAKEMRDFLEATDIASEIKRALTSLAFEVRTEIRFVPTDAQSSGVRPKVSVRTATVRRAERRRNTATHRQPKAAKP